MWVSFQELNDLYKHLLIFRVGGPMREIARFTKSTIIGINNNAYQVSRGNLQNKAAVI